MNKSPEISVIMPVYNGEKYLEEAIESILNQTYDDFEFLIVYDASSDKSLSIIKKFEKQDKRVVLVNGEGKKLIHALNKGIKKSKGRYIARMDSDDISCSSRFQVQVDFMKKNQLDICGGHCLSIDENSRVDELYTVPMNHDMCTLSMLFKVPFFHPSVVIRKSFLSENFLEYGQSKYRAAEDFDLWVRMHKSGAMFGNVDKIILKYRVLDSSLSRTNKISVAKNTKSIVRQFYKDNNLEISHIVKNILLQNLNREERSIIVRYVYNEIKRLNFSNFNLLKEIDGKNILNSVLSEVTR